MKESRHRIILQELDQTGVVAVKNLKEMSTVVILKDKNLEPQIINWIDYGFYVKEFYKIYDPAFIKPLCIHNIFFKKIDCVFKILFVRSVLV